MRGEKVRYSTNKLFSRTIILVLLMVLILSSIPLTVASNTALTSIENTITYHEESQEMPINHVIPDMMQEDNVSKDEKPALSSPLFIKMKAAEFDPLIEGPILPSNLVYFSENGYYLAQCIGPIQSGWAEEIRTAGASILGYIPDYTYILGMDEEAKEKVENLAFIRWIGIYHPAYKIQGGLADKTGEIELNVLVFRDKEENLPKVRDSLKALGCAITYDGEDNNIIRVRLDASKSRSVAFIPEVEWIDEYLPPKASMNKIRVFTGANTVHINGINGSGVVGEVKDDGIDLNHPDFAGQIIGTDGLIIDKAHGTCAFGIVFSSGVNNANALGMLPGGKGVFCDWNVSRTTSVSNLVNNWGGVFQSNSWSSNGLDSNYTIVSYENDQAVFNYDIVMLHSAGNSDYGVYPKSCSQDSVAKNVISVGALFHYDNFGRTDDKWVDKGIDATPSQGPASDGRIKPDLSGPFDWIYTTDSVDGDGENGYAAGNYYDDFGGTSGATPVVAGAVGLVYQMYKENHFGNNPAGVAPHASTVKAILIADAYQYDFSQANRYQQGWGGVDVSSVYNIGENHFIVDEAKSLQTGESINYTIVPSGGGPLKISLVWTDVPGTTSSSQHLVNDLDLKVTDPDGVVYWGNHNLNTSKWSASGGTADSLNNVENVFIENPTPGIWTLEVSGGIISMDANPSTPATDQAFALVASGAVWIETLKVNVTYPSSGEILNDIITITGTSSIDISQVQIKIDNGDWENATGTTDWSYDWDTSSFSDGDYVIYVRGSNGTVYTEVVSVEVTVDNTPPSTSIAIGEPKHFNGSLWLVGASTPFILTADDYSGSGVNATYYRVWHEGIKVEDWTDGNLFTLTWGEGNYTIQYYSDDNLGNEEGINGTNVYLDSAPPSTQMDIGSPKHRNASSDHWNRTGKTNFTLSAFEEHTSIEATWYTIDGEYSEGLTFNLSGYSDGAHIITWGSEDNLGNNETGNTIIVILDTNPPITNLTVGTPKFRSKGNDDWNVSNSTVFALSSLDLYSGVNTTWYTVDGQYFEGASFALVGLEEGLHTITWGSIDNLGNNETGNTKRINLDTSPPITNISVGTPRFRATQTDHWNVTTSTEFTIIQNGDGDGSGINFTWYTIDDVYYVYSAPFTLTPGLHTISCGGIDNLGMNETGDSQQIMVDAQPPKTNLSIGSPKFRESATDFWNVTNVTEFTLQSADQFSGLNFSWYTIDGKYFEGTNFNLIGYADSYHTITWGARDKLGNNETGNITIVYLHTTSPITTLEIEGKKYRMSVEDHWYVADETNFTLLPGNTHTGIDFTWYTIDGNYFEGTFFTLLDYNEGEHYITWGSKDNLGFNESGNAITVILDNTPPETDIDIGGPKYRADIEDHWAVNGSTIFTLASADNYSGISYTWYTIDDVHFVGTSFTLFGYADGLHTIVWGSEDNLGHNETPHTLSVVLDDTPPLITIEIGQPNRYLDTLTYITSSTPITLLFEDTGINKSTIYYSLDLGTIYYTYDSPFTVLSTTTSIIYGGKDVLGNQAGEYIINIVVDNSDTDGDGIFDLNDPDDDNDGLLDSDEDVNDNGVVDKGETDPLNPDTDGDGHWDGVDAYALDKDRWKKEEDSMSILLMIPLIVAIVTILLFLLLRKKGKKGEAKIEWVQEEETRFELDEKQVDWAEEEETRFEPDEEQVEWTEEDETKFEPDEEQVDWTEEEETRFEPDEEQVEWSEEEEMKFEPDEEQVEWTEEEETKFEPDEEQVEWAEEYETKFEPDKEQVEWTEEDETKFEPNEEQADWTDGKEAKVEPHEGQVKWT